MNLRDYVLSKIPKFKNLGLPTFDAMDIHNIEFTPSTRAKSLNGTQRDNFRKPGWDICMILKERAKRQHTVIILRILNQKIEKFLREKRKIFHRHDKRIW